MWANIQLCLTSLELQKNFAINRYGRQIDRECNGIKMLFEVSWNHLCFRAGELKIELIIAEETVKEAETAEEFWDDFLVNGNCFWYI